MLDISKVRSQKEDAQSADLNHGKSGENLLVQIYDQGQDQQSKSKMVSRHSKLMSKQKKRMNLIYRGIKSKPIFVELNEFYTLIQYGSYNVL